MHIPWDVVTSGRSQTQGLLPLRTLQMVYPGKKQAWIQVEARVRRSTRGQLLRTGPGRAGTGGHRCNCHNLGRKTRAKSMRGKKNWRSKGASLGQGRPAYIPRGGT